MMPEQPDYMLVSLRDKIPGEIGGRSNPMDQPQRRRSSGSSRWSASELLSTAIASGRAHVAGLEGGEPEEPGAWGWRHATVGTGDYEREEWRPLGERVGWVEKESLYLLPEAAYAAVQKQGQDSGEPLTITERTLRKRLHERGLLLSVEDSRPTLAVRRTLEGRRRGVLHLSADFLSLHTNQPDQSDHDEEKQPKHAHYAPSLWSGQKLTAKLTKENGVDKQETSALVRFPMMVASIAATGR